MHSEGDLLHTVTTDDISETRRRVGVWMVRLSAALVVILAT